MGSVDGRASDPGRPRVSVVLTTRDRPRFVPLALAGYRQQSYPAHDRELIVVDDGDRFPVDEAEVAAAGGTLVRLPPGTPLGSKLNAGIARARGLLIQKMDDDDWYGPDFLAASVAALDRRWRVACRPALVFLSPFLFFDLARWEIRRSRQGHLPGATLLFPRDIWEEQPFRPLPGDEDVWFLLDQARLGAVTTTSGALESYLAVRHAGLGDDRGHTWTHQATGQALDDYTRYLQPYARSPEELLPAWAVTAYRAMRVPMPAPGTTMP
ncbi:MAG: glycosyltransferase family 2 protein [Thermomicrobiales bacterium]|nr:glycosyltransferase family 2 protein [Thermomicrobiales bacterium]